jgi:hypothetical protein
MIQRIQSLFLAASAIAVSMMFLFPIADFLSGSELGNFKLYATGLKSLDPDPKVIPSVMFGLPLAILSVASVLMPLVILFLYRKRPLQIRLLAFNILINIVLVIVVLMYYGSAVQKLTGIPPNYDMGAFFPLISLILLILANRYIRKDEMLVKSADRLR